MSAYVVIVALECIAVGLVFFLAFQLVRIANKNPLKRAFREDSVPTLTDEVIEVSGVAYKPAFRRESSIVSLADSRKRDILPEDAISVAKPEVRPVAKPEPKYKLNDKALSASEKTPATDVLSDYIGEFFTEDLQTDLNEMRAPSHELSKQSKALKVDDVVTNKAESKDFAVQESELNEPLRSSGEEFSLGLTASTNEVENTADKAKNLEVKEELKVEAKEDLKEESKVVRAVILSDKERIHSEQDDDAIITVAKENEVGIVAGNNKTMSGKVVHAMLSEAEIVCAS